MSVLPTYQATASLLAQAFGWIRQIAHRLDGEGSAAKAEHNLLDYLTQISKETTAPLVEWVQHFEKITQSFLPKLFSYLQQPLLPLTNNELEIFIGQLKKRRRQVTGRKNTQAFILREGSAVAILFGLPQETDWLESFAQVNLDDFHTSLAALRRGEQRSKCWRIRRALKNYLSGLEQRWLNSA